MRLLLLVCCIVVSATILKASPVVEVEVAKSGKQYLAYDQRPLLAFGPGDENRLISAIDHAKVERWARWQRQNGMNLLRAYPTCVPLPGSLAPFKSKDGKWDVDAWNDDYFRNISQTISILERNGIILHLQLWQIVWFKEDKPDRWAANFLNPANNINDWTKAYPHGSDYMNAPSDSPAGRHRKAWVMHILGAVKGHKNVWIDVINELGNGGIGDMKWASEVVSWIREWEKTSGQKLLVGVDMCNFDAQAFGSYQKGYDLLIFNELHRDEVLGAVRQFHKPAVTVRSSDGSNRMEDYLFLNAASVGPEHQTRYRTLCYRSIFSGVQSIGAYWKPDESEVDYKDMKDLPRYSRFLRKFWQKLSPEWPNLVVDDSIVTQAVTPYAYGLRSDHLYAVYLECGPHASGNTYAPSNISVRCPFPEFRTELFEPRTGKSLVGKATRQGDSVAIELPEFTEDIVVLIWAADYNANEIPDGRLKPQSK